MLEAMAHGLTPPVAMPAPVAHRSAFRELMSELNPLQYLPVVGTLYRAVTGDTIPETARAIGGLVMSGLTGGPIGIALNVASLALEKATGIDPERIGSAVLADLGIGRAVPEAVATLPAARPPIAVVAAWNDEAAGPASPVAPLAWSAAQMRSYGVVASADGILTQQVGGDVLRGADVLNALELTRLAADDRAIVGAPGQTGATLGVAVSHTGSNGAG